MSFSSTSSKESSAVHNPDRNGSTLHSSLSEPGKEKIRSLVFQLYFFVTAISVPTSVSNKPFEKDLISVNGNETKNSTIRSIIPPITTTTEQT